MSCKAGPRHHPVRLRRPELTEALPGLRRPADRFTIDLTPPDLSFWRDGLPGFRIFDSGMNGPEIVVTALIHGNEFAGAIALERLRLENPVPVTGRLTLILANLAAFESFNAQRPLLSRYRDEDLNRVWNAARLGGRESSAELERARQIRPFIERADLLLDLHSTLWPSAPLFIVPPRLRSAQLGQSLASMPGLPSLVLTDLGHQGGPRLIEADHFMSDHGTGRSCLLEAGQHWSPSTVDVAYQTVKHLINNASDIHLRGQTEHQAQSSRSAVVTDNILARTAAFAFAEPWHGGTIIPQAGTVIARDGDDLICTPYDDCLLIMPNLRPAQGQLAVRLAMLAQHGAPV